MATENYEFIRALIDCDGNLNWRYKFSGAPSDTMSHDEKVTAWSDEHVVNLTRSMLDVDADDDVEIDVIWE